MSYNYSSDSDVSLFDSIEQSGQQAPPSDPPSAPPTEDWIKNMTPEQLESMRQFIMKQQEEAAARLKKQQEEEAARLKKQQEEEEARRKKQEEEEAARLKKQQEEEEAARLKKKQEEEARRKKKQEEEALARLKQEDDARRKNPYVPYVPISNKVFPPPRSYNIIQVPPPPPPPSNQQIPPPPRVLARPSAFVENQKLGSNPKEETKIEGEEEEVDHEQEQEPVHREPYKPPKSVHDMKSNSDYKEDNVRPFDFRDEMERIIEENENLKDRLTKLEERMTGVEFHIEDINHNAEELRKDIDNSDEYTIELMKLELAPKKVAKYINKIHDLKKDVSNLKNAQQAGPPTDDAFAEKLTRSNLMMKEADYLKNMLEAVESYDKKKAPDPISVFKSYGWKLSNCVYHLRPYLSQEEKEKLDKACSFERGGKKQSPKQVLKAIRQFGESMEKNEIQRNSESKSKGHEFQYHFPHLEDNIVDDDDYPQ